MAPRTGQPEDDSPGMVERWAHAMEEMVGAMTAEQAQDFYDQISLAESGEDRPAAFREQIGALTPGAGGQDAATGASEQGGSDDE
jgi:hypothetical protein